jgi:uncharacterized protein (DUF1697 family)
MRVDKTMNAVENTDLRYAAFLRGINVGPHKRIEMEALRKVFEAAGYQQVKTFLASGNVLFNAAEEDASLLASTVEQLLENAFAFKVDVILRSLAQLQELVQADPFKDIPLTPQTRLYVTFLSELPEVRLEIPAENPHMGFRRVRVTDSEVCSVVELSPGYGTTEAMRDNDKELGKKTTTRNWNTIQKMVKG